LPYSRYFWFKICDKEDVDHLMNTFKKQHNTITANCTVDKLSL
jgi:hypothetical protein